MPLPLLAAAIPAAASALGSILGARNQRKANEANRDLAREQMVNNERMWNLNNSYNDPQQQMQRLTNAGLNPNLIYGTGTSAATGSSGAPAKSYDRATDQPIPMDIGTPFQTFQDTQLKTAQTDNLRKQNDVIIQEAALKGVQIAATEANRNKTVAETHVAKELREASLQASLANIRQIEANTRNAESRTSGQNITNKTMSQSQAAQVQKIGYEAQNASETLKGTRLDNKMKDLELELNKLGIQKGDPIYMRAIGRFWDDIINSSKKTFEGYRIKSFERNKQ